MADGGEGDDVPGFFLEDVESHEVNIGFGVGLALVGEGAAGMDLVEAVAAGFAGGLDLDTPAGVAVVDNEVIFNKEPNMWALIAEMVGVVADPSSCF